MDGVLVALHALIVLTLSLVLVLLVYPSRKSSRGLVDRASPRWSILIVEVVSLIAQIGSLIKRIVKLLWHEGPRLFGTKLVLPHLVVGEDWLVVALVDLSWLWPSLGCNLVSLHVVVAQTRITFQTLVFVNGEH